MFVKSQSFLFSVSKLFHQHQQWRGMGAMTKVRLKWVKNKNLDHVIDTETDLKAACILKDAIKRSPTGITIRENFNCYWNKRYPTLFHEFPHARYASLPCFKLTDTALMLDSQEEIIHQSHEADTVERLCRVLMMMRSKTVSLRSLHSLKFDLGLPDNYEKTLVMKYPDHFCFVKASNGNPCLKLVKWRDEFAFSALQKRNEDNDVSGEESRYREFKRGQSTLTFPMSFPRGYGAQKKVKAWMDEFQKLPYISPYDDPSNIDPESDLMEKRAVAVLHELLSLTIHKKTKRNYLRSMRAELNIPHKFTRLFTRYPGIFYLSLKCKTTTVILKEGYRRGKLVDPHPLTRLRDKFYHVMRTGFLYRARGLGMVSKEELLLDRPEDDLEEEGSEEEEIVEGSELEEDSEAE
ncbi:Ubiquitin carboxyl-terminal hydrolase family protein [Arabidopsis thaliana]|uniref:Ubiquitin carboxyl-terminal hydrolase family protein n=1 Tax=Arabidopsis thaliana TaxID=3702 RepID=F4J5W3_ARATH|nr:Ubiquitin carboxyl-terminal hydrolase family protein [Arabidopsis thaliana]AEE79795.1 Ubiquitin carboxyl-terminal hydrolase family protein [Arabidopsis thaliana]|eukprot:NP_001154682.1 Ubiquitin carboxyl-terminal hydrolase family protein [Arabidopsis thaliana]